MKDVELFFYGYTWEEYAYQIEDHSGVYVVYSGHLDSEGLVVIKKLLYIDYYKRFSEFFDGDIFSTLKAYLKHNERLFFSYAEYLSEEEGREIVSWIKKSLNMSKKDFNSNKKIKKIISKGDCKFIPNEIII